MDDKPSIRAIDVVLLPDEAMTSRAIDANDKLADRKSREIVLHPTTCLPHVSLAMGCIAADNVASAATLLVEVAQRHRIGRLYVTGVVTSLNARGRTVSVFAVEKTRELQRLHVDVIDTLKPLLTYDVTAEMFYADEPIAQTSIEWVRTFAQKAAYDSYFPHITLGYGRVTQTLTFPIPFTASALAVCHLGNHCTCREILASIDV